MGRSQATAEFGSNAALLDLSAQPSVDLEALEKKTCTIWKYHEADVTDRENLKRVMDPAIHTFGCIDSWFVFVYTVVDLPINDVAMTGGLHGGSIHLEL